MHKLTKGIAAGQAIDPNHILRLANALAGIDTNDIIIKGSLTSIGNFGVSGDSSITGSINISSNLSISGSIYGSRFIITKNGDLVSNNIYSKVVNTQNLIVSSSIILKDLQQVQSTNFISIEPSTGILSYSTGSLREENIWFTEKFKFTSLSTEDSTSFHEKIYNLSLYNTDSIDYVEIYSKKDISTLSWTKHKNLDSLQDWIEKEVDKNYWIKLIAVYKIYMTGNAESILSYTNE